MVNRIQKLGPFPPPCFDSDSNGDGYDDDGACNGADKRDGVASTHEFFFRFYFLFSLGKPYGFAQEALTSLNQLLNKPANAPGKSSK